MGNYRCRQVKNLLIVCLIIMGTTIINGNIMVSAHGTTDQKITEDMLNDTPDADYKINEAYQGEAENGDYDAYFPETDIQEVSIEIDENNLNYLLQNAQEKPYVMTDSVTIAGETLGYAGLKTKGDYTLKHTDTDYPDSDRFSFTIHFGKYIKKDQYGAKQNFHGCSKICFNNFFFDKTMMKEYFSMKLMQEMGLPTPKFCLAKLYINGEYYGVYFMVEAMDESILERYYGVDDKELSDYLTKPITTNLVYDKKLDRYQREDGSFDLSEVLTMNENGEYTADQKFAKIVGGLWEEEEDKLQDVASMMPIVLSWDKKLTQLSHGKDFEGNKIDVNGEEYMQLLESIMDVDETVRYFAVHSFLVQLDNMFDNNRNYGLYIGQDGRSLMIPWDYDLSFGTFHPGTSEETANYDIDNLCWFANNYTEVAIQTKYSQHPIFQVIFQNKALMDLYHQYMGDCSKIAYLGGTTSTGQAYDPVWFYSYIQAMKEKLIQAASEPLADNVYYLNHTVQPLGVIQGLPNLSKIIAMRSVAVWSQTQGTYTYVSGVGVDLSTLGNGLQDFWNARFGNLASVDHATGIFICADYGGEIAELEDMGDDFWEQNMPDAPQFSLTEAEKESTEYQQFLNSAEIDNKENLTVYKLSLNIEPDSVIRVTVPFSPDSQEHCVYILDHGEVQSVQLIMDGNLGSFEMAQAGYIGVVSSKPHTGLQDEGENKQNAQLSQKTKESNSSQENAKQALPFLIGILCAILVLEGYSIRAVRSEKYKDLCRSVTNPMIADEKSPSDDSFLSCEIDENV